MYTFKERQWFNQWWVQCINIGLVGFMGYMLYKWYILDEAIDKVAANDYSGQIFVLVLLAATVAFLYSIRLYTMIDDRGIHYKFFPIHRQYRLIPWYAIQECIVQQYNPIMDYGGWGYKMTFSQGKAINVRGNMGIKIHYGTSKKLMLGTQRPEEAVKIIERYFKNKNIT